MTNAHREKGKEGERALAKYLRANGFPYAERMKMISDFGDVGDIVGTPGLVWDAKNRETHKLAPYMDQLNEEMTNARCEIGAIIAKRPRKTDVGDWYAIMPTSVYLRLLREAGYTADE